MANIKLKGIGINQAGFHPSGNLTTYRARLETAANGSALNSNSPVALLVTDKVYLQTLPAGMLLETAHVIVSTAMTAGVTGSLGFEYADGIDVPAVPQDAAYFGAGIALSAVARIPNASAKALVTLPKEASLILTIAGAANAKVSRVDFVVHGERLGAP